MNGALRAPCFGSAAPARARSEAALLAFAPAAAGVCGESAPGVARNCLRALSHSVDARTRPTVARVGNWTP